jgi:acylphosphatase
MNCRLFRVSGRVQGVGFRFATKDRARELGLGGYAANLADGRVEVLACGDEVALSELEAWLRTGPPAARVRDVTSENVEGVDCTDFTIR